MGPDDQVDLAGQRGGQLAIGDPRPAAVVHLPETEMREDDDEARALLAQLARVAPDRLDLVERLEAVVAHGQEIPERVGHADEADAVDRRRGLHASHRDQVREQQRVARCGGVVGEDLRAVAQPHGVPDAGGLAPRSRKDRLHRRALGQVREPVRRLLEVAGVDVQDGMIRLGADAPDERRDARQLLHPPVEVVRVQDRDPGGHGQADEAATRPTSAHARAVRQRAAPPPGGGCAGWRT